jgi:leucyl-tRNA synthetase
MPGYAGSSWYFLRYMDPHNDNEFAKKSISSYWNQVDLYVGGTEHAVGHLLYSRMWTKALYDLGLITFDEPFKRLLNQGMIQGSSRFVYRLTIKKGSNENNKKPVLEFPIFFSFCYYQKFERGNLSKFEMQELIN